MSVSVVIPTTLRRQIVDEVVRRALEAVSPLDGELLVVVNGPVEGRHAPPDPSPRLRIIDSPVATVAAARNVGLREARNDIVLFTDDDCLVSPEWCEVLGARLRDGAVAVATPLRVGREGPVTAFLDYQRYFSPSPLGPDTVRHPIGAAIGVRRSRIDVTFQEEMTAGDDAEFGIRLREAGFSIELAHDAPPPIHALPEGLESITERFRRYGGSTANLSLLRGRTEFLVPHAAGLHAALARNDLATPRRFEEIADENTRDVFATLAMAAVASWLVGYLDRAGSVLGRTIISLDEPALAEGWRALGLRLERDASGPRDWTGIPVDLRRWSRPQPGRRPAATAEVAVNLARNTSIAGDGGPDPDLDRLADDARRQADQTWERANEIWSDLRAGTIEEGLDPIDGRLRAAGVPFSEGMRVIETIAQGSIEPPDAT